MQTYKIGDRHIATLKVTGVKGGYIASGDTVHEAIKNVFKIAK